MQNVGSKLWDWQVQVAVVREKGRSLYVTDIALGEKYLRNQVFLKRAIVKQPAVDMDNGIHSYKDTQVSNIIAETDNTLNNSSQPGITDKNADKNA